jgi:tetratricopeptide (TPR) repeat protein
MITSQELEKKVRILTNKLKVGLFDEAISGGKRLLKISKDPIIVNILSLAYQAKGDYSSSIELLKNKLRSAPNNIFFLNNIGLSYLKKNELKDAEYYFKRALEINPNYINILNNYGNLKRELNLFDESIDYFNKALLIDDNSLEINFNLAIAYQGKGDYKNSIKFFNKALKINPLFTKSDRNLSSMTNYTKDNEHLLKMKEKLLDEKLNINQKVEIHFALGKAYEDIKDYKNSFKNLEKANYLMKKITQYNFENDQVLFQKIKNYFTKNIINPINQNKIKTIFIVGMPRSGTSLVEQIISSHDKVFGGGELVYISEIVNEKFLNNLDSLQDLDKLLTEAQKDYIFKISHFNDQLYNFTDKSPLNFRWIGFILNMLPNSKIIHCKRDKLDVCWSNYKNQFEGTLYFSNNFQDLGRYYKIYEDLMIFWEEKFSSQIYNLNYDNLINNSEKTIRELIHFCDLEWDEKCLKHHENKRVIKTVSFNQARKPIYKSKVRNISLYDTYLDDLKNSLNIKKGN